MAARIVRPAFAVLVLGLAAHALNAVIGPGGAPANEAVASWVHVVVLDTDRARTSR